MPKVKTLEDTDNSERERLRGSTEERTRQSNDVEKNQFCINKRLTNGLALQKKLQAPEANLLLALNLSPNFHKRKGAGNPSPTAMNPRTEFPHP